MEKKNKGKFIAVRLTEEEKVMVEKKCEEEYLNISNYIRRLILKDINNK